MSTSIEECYYFGGGLAHFLPAGDVSRVVVDGCSFGSEPNDLMRDGGGPSRTYLMAMSKQIQSYVIEKRAVLTLFSRSQRFVPFDHE